jgi:hypothetical protein
VTNDGSSRASGLKIFINGQTRHRGHHQRPPHQEPSPAAAMTTSASASACVIAASKTDWSMTCAFSIATVIHDHLDTKLEHAAR